MDILSNYYNFLGAELRAVKSDIGKSSTLSLFTFYFNNLVKGFLNEARVWNNCQYFMLESILEEFKFDSFV